MTKEIVNRLQTVFPSVQVGADTYSFSWREAISNGSTRYHADYQIGMHAQTKPRDLIVEQFKVADTLASLLATDPKKPIHYGMIAQHTRVSLSISAAELQKTSLFYLPKEERTLGSSCCLFSYCMGTEKDDEDSRLEQDYRIPMLHY